MQSREGGGGGSPPLVGKTVILLLLLSALQQFKTLLFLKYNLFSLFFKEDINYSVNKVRSRKFQNNFYDCNKTTTDTLSVPVTSVIKLSNLEIIQVGLGIIPPGWFHTWKPDILRTFRNRQNILIKYTATPSQMITQYRCGCISKQPLGAVLLPAPWERNGSRW